MGNEIRLWIHHFKPIYTNLNLFIFVRILFLLLLELSYQNACPLKLGQGLSPSFHPKFRIRVDIDRIRIPPLRKAGSGFRDEPAEKLDPT